MNKKKPILINKKIELELKPLLNSIRKMNVKSANFILFKRALHDFSPKYGRAWKTFGFITRDMEWYTEYDAKEEIQTLFAYLGLTESLGNTFVNLLVMLIVANGIDFHIENIHETPHIRHANSIEDLEKNRVPLHTKLNFLEDSGITEFVKIINRQLRNDIAHLNFDVRDDQVYIRGRPAFEHVTNSYANLLDAIKTVDILIRRLVKDRGDLVPKNK
jgi:hypothetical protein